MTDDERTVDELQDELRDRGLKVSGTKDELVDRLREHDDDRDDDHDDEDGEDGEDGESQAAAPSGGSGPGLREVVGRIREDFVAVVGADVERVTGLVRHDEGWRAEVDVVEISRVPPSTDVLATYEVLSDAEGGLASFERIRRFRRSDGDER